MARTRGQPLLLVVIAWNRPESLRRLLHSLEAADYGAAPAPMEVRFALDYSENATATAAIDEAIAALQWPHGAVLVKRRARRAGLRDNVLGSWTGEEGRAAVMLEDDVEVSALWWHWVQAALERYASLPAVVGVSLFTPDELNEAYENGGSRDAEGKFVPSCGWQQEYHRATRTGGGAASGASAVLFAQPCSWGAVYLPGPWRAFQRRARELRSAAAVPELPCPGEAVAGAPRAARRCKVTANRWGRSSWKRLLVYHMVEQGLALAYPNLQGRASFSTNHVEPGQHIDAPALQGQRRRHRVALVDAAFCRRHRLRCAAHRAAAEAEDAAGSPAHAEAATGEAADAAPPFALPAAREVALYDFYCRRQPDGAAGFAALAAAGAEVRAAARPLEPGGDEAEWDEADAPGYVHVRTRSSADSVEGHVEL